MKLPELGSFIRDQRRAARLSLRKLSDLAGISNPYLSQIERGLRKPSAEILQAIAQALRISAETLYERAGLLDVDRVSDLVSEILNDPNLSQRQKQALVETYRSFRETDDDIASVAATVPASSAGTDDGVAAVRRETAAADTARKHAAKKAARKVVARKTSTSNEDAR